MASLEQIVELLIKEIHISDELKSKAIQFNCWNHPKIQDFYLQLCWRELEEAMPNGELLLEPTDLLDGHWPDQMETPSDVTDIELVEAEKVQRYLMLFIRFNVNNDILISTPG